MELDLVNLLEQFRSLTDSQIFHDWGIIGLLLNSLLSATALPIPTEILTASLLAGGENPLYVVLALVIGSTIGGVLNYFIGFGGTKLFRRFRKKHDDDTEKKGHKWLERFGLVAIFFAPFILIVGDLILISAGARKYNFTKFIIFMIAGKAFKAVVTVFGLSVIF